ncbi:MAG TPA: beta-galactosidase [Cytophagaceae bacterium]|jgi:beta-galactosidase
MKYRLLIILPILLWSFFFSTNLCSQTPPKNIVPAKDMMQVGVYYYPEQWPASQWERDIKNISNLGFEFIHVGEFAWAFMEPEEGKYDFKWLDNVVDLAAKYKLKVIMCTPTPCPPAWLAIKHPEMFNVNNNGLLTGHGSRGNASRSSEVYIEYSRKIVEELGKRYGNDKRIWGWQLDNEPGAPKDYGTSGEKMFQKWLKNRYSTIDNLNKNWGAAFWSLTYNNFEQIVPPNLNFLYGASPHAVLDFQRFTADQEASFLNMQVDALRKHVAKDQWITTNYIAMDSRVDQRRAEKLDFVSYTVYPVDGRKFIDSLGFRIGWNDGISFANDFYRPIKKTYGVMEIQPGQVNWARINPQPLPGAVRMWLWHIYSGGASFLCTYRYRQPLYGSELYHSGITKPDGVTLSQGGSEFKQVMDELRILRKQYDPKAVAPSAYNARKTGILWNHDNMWDMDHHKQTAQWNFQDHVKKYQAILKSFAAPVDYINENDNLSDYKFLILPAYQLLDSSTTKKLDSYVRNGGNLVMTCRTGHKTKNGMLWEGKWAAPILGLIGAEIPFFDVLLEDIYGTVKKDGRSYKWNNWAEIIEPNKGTEVLATYSDQYYAGKAAATWHKLGKGNVLYIGVDTDNGALEKDILKMLFERNNVKTENLPEGVYMHWRDGFWTAVNYSSSPVQLQIPKDATIVVGRQPLDPADVIIWK